MRGFVRNHKTLTALLLIGSPLLGPIGWVAAAPIRGQLAAQLALVRGNYTVLAYGLAWPWHREAAQLLRERYGIEKRVVAGCVVSQSFAAYVDSYNGAIMRAANRRFGRDVFKESEADARRNWELQHPDSGTRGRNAARVLPYAKQILTYRAVR